MRVHVFHTGAVCVSPNLPFGGEDCNPIKASGIFQKRSERIWLPVSAYLIESDHGLVLVDTGWDRSMSPNGTLDKEAQIASLGSRALYLTNQGVIAKGMAIGEQLAAMGIKPQDLDYVILTHLDCDHANGVPQIVGARHIVTSADELASINKNVMARIRYQSKWWEGSGLKTFDWNGTEGPFHKSYDLFGDGSIVCIAIPGHSDGLCAVRVSADDGRFVLLFSDGGYGEKSWRELIPSGIANNRADQMTSLRWIREQSLDPKCVESLANHDQKVKPHVIEL
ncbi:MAG: N-acyl homoserine lactonase family protein [Tractidigestivibacter sp.]|jgi:N-acyl homoserine lactone hydrolase|uniref:N-acyl homoserine lactonase family protein n=1 Tax=Tractidigestivibacter sp. TaxID=2847320 RepID=UPI003D8DB1E5